MFTNNQKLQTLWSLIPLLLIGAIVLAGPFAASGAPGGC